MSRWARTLTTEEPDPLLDLDDYVGQRSSTYRFELVDAVTGYRVEVKPIRDSVPTLTHMTGRVIKRQLMGLFFGVEDTLLFNSITSRLDVTMLLGDREFALGRYMPNGRLEFQSTAGSQSNGSFYDEMFIVDQELTNSFGSFTAGEPIPVTIGRALLNLPITYTLEASPYVGTIGWSMGTRRGYVIEQLSIDGDYFSPWFDHTNVMRFIRSFDPATAIPTFDLDSGNKVMRSRITKSDDLIEAPNRFVVVSNGVSAVGANGIEAIGVYDIPSSAPHSAANRGFIVQKTLTRQLESVAQAAAVAKNIGQQSTVFETIELYTAPDPRHDSYDVLRWDGVNWLEIAWSLPLVEGGQMQHVARRVYGD